MKWNEWNEMKWKPSKKLEGNWKDVPVSRTSVVLECRVESCVHLFPDLVGDYTLVADQQPRWGYLHLLNQQMLLYPCPNIGLLLRQRFVIMLLAELHSTSLPLPLSGSSTYPLFCVHVTPVSLPPWSQYFMSAVSKLPLPYKDTCDFF